MRVGGLIRKSTESIRMLNVSCCLNTGVFTEQYVQAKSKLYVQHPFKVSRGKLQIDIKIWTPFQYCKILRLSQERPEDDLAWVQTSMFSSQAPFHRGRHTKHIVNESGTGAKQNLGDNKKGLTAFAASP